MRDHYTIKPGAVRGGAIVLLLIAATFGGRAWAITHGEPDGNRHPNVGALVVYNPAIGEIHTISGTLIHPRVVLTAGHVVTMIKSGQVILLGVTFDQEPKLGDPTTWLDVSSVVGAFTGFNSDPKGMDIGALILRDPVTSITPALLPDIGLLDDLREAGKLQAGPEASRFTVVGYGMVLDYPPPRLSWEDPPTRNMAVSGFRAMNGGWLHLNQNQAQGYGGTARGDSGGPTFWTDPETNQEFLVAVTSWGDMPCVADSVSYRVDTPEALQFVEDTIAGLGN
jgi:hypothetical protein